LPWRRRILCVNNDCRPHADAHSLVNLNRTDIWPSGMDHRSGVVLGLEQTGHDQSFVGADGIGRRLQSQVRPGKDRAVELPPTFLPCLTGHLQQGVGFVGRHSVDLEDVADIAGRGSALARFDSRDRSG
jgi:hypothetical protein